MMANVQLEHGYTKIANELLEVLAKTPLNGTQLRIILVLWRYTYGYNRKEHELSESFISKATGIHKKQIQRELNELIKYGLVFVVKEATFTSPRIIQFNKDYESWEVTKKLTGSELVTSPGNELVPSPEPQKKSNNPAENSKNADSEGEVAKKLSGSELVTQEIKYLNKNIKQMGIDDFFEKLWLLYPKKRGKGKVSKAQKERLYKIGADELTRAINRYKQEIAGKDEQYIMYGSTFFNSGYVDYLDANYEGRTEPKPNAEYLRLKEMVNGGQSTGI
ncbi:MAG: hypothetical protein PWR06_2349 [Thermoanaerobacteraceae bacterium]|nr:hypothetical protein [Thermoanaerobacteraceae bacterium]